MGSMKRAELNSQQGGFVAIVVAAMLIVLMALITIGFTRLIQRDQRQVLDRQLSQQALYAAESGINDVYTMLRGNASLTEKTDCDVEGMPNDGIIDAEAGVAYTCALYDRTPSDLTFSLSTDESKLSRLSSGGAIFKTIRLSWGVDGSANTNNVNGLPSCADAGKFPVSRAGNIPLLRFDLTTLGSFDRASLINATDSLYLAPCQDASASTANHTYSNPVPSKGVVVPVKCDPSPGLSQPCVVTLNVNGVNSVDFMSRMRAVYAPALLTITATDTNDNAISMVGGQTIIDVTGRAQDITRRLRVTVPEVDVTGVPDGVAQIFNGFCKLMRVESNGTVMDTCP